MKSPLLSLHVAAPVERTFDVFSDLDAAADRISSIVRIEKLTEGPTGLGTRWKETRVMFKREATEEMDISAWEPPHHYTAHADTCGVSFDSTFRFRPEGDGTRVELDVTTRPLTFRAHLMKPLGFLMAGAMKKAMLKDLDELKRVAEQSD